MPENSKCVCGFSQSSPIPHEHDQTDREKEIIKYFSKNKKDCNARILKVCSLQVRLLKIKEILGDL